MPSPAEVIRLLKDKGLTLGSAESLTGGLFGAEVCKIPGASSVYKGGIIAYTPAIKNALLGVSLDLIQDKGIVSHEVAYAMAEGGLKALEVDMCVSCTGNAGPTAQEGEEPVGSVYIGVTYQGQTKTMHLELSGDRNQIRMQTVEKMFSLISSVL